MRIVVKLFGSLPERVSGYDRVRGLPLDVPDNSTVREVIAGLGLSDADWGVATCGGRIVDGGSTLSAGAVLSVLQSAHGG
jgi:hypothetical protein